MIEHNVIQYVKKCIPSSNQHVKNIYLLLLRYLPTYIQYTLIIKLIFQNINENFILAPPPQIEDKMLPL